MAKYNSQGWHHQTQRHSNARRTGKAGGKYAKNHTSSTSSFISKLKSSWNEASINNYEDIMKGQNFKLIEETNKKTGKKKYIIREYGLYSKLKYIKNKKEAIKQFKKKENINSGSLKKENKLEYKPIIPINDKAELPVQFSITIPSTRDANKSIGEKGLQKRVDEINKWMIERFYGDTTIKGKGDYESNGKIINEDVAVIEVSTTPESFNAHKKELAKLIKDKRKAWGQKQLAYTTEGDLFLYPKDPDKTPIN